MKKKLKNNKEETRTAYKPSAKVLLLKKDRKERWEIMLKKKKDLGIDERCNRFDNLFTPHYVSLNNPDGVQIQFSSDFEEDTVIVDEARKSMPLAWQKITTAMAVLIAENPKGVMRATDSKYKPLNNLIKNVYYENFKIRNKIRVLRKYLYHKAKYGIAYWREYIQKSYKEQLKEIEALNLISKESLYDEDGFIKYDSKLIYDIFDVVGENLHPHKVVLDDACYGVKDVNRPARDLFIFDYKSQDDFDDEYPKEVYKNAEFVWAGQKHMVQDDNYSDDYPKDDKEKKIQIIIYENRKTGVIEKWAGDYVLLDIAPLPGGELSVSGGKWSEDRDNYDGIGVCHVLELYQPLVDDLVNATDEYIRQVVRPNEDFFNGAHISDESDDISYGAGNRRTIEGSPNDVKYSYPQTDLDKINNRTEKIYEEIDLSTSLPRNLSGVDEAKTAYQSAQNREAALTRLSIPLDSTKDTIQDCANLDLKLYPILYSVPKETIIYKPGEEGWDEAFSIYQKSLETGKEDERVVAMSLDDNGEPIELARRRFESMELPLAIVDDKPNGRIIETEEMEFWEMIPKHFNYEGHIEIEAKSFIPVSKAVEDEMDRNTLDKLLSVPTVDEMGNPTLKDASGKPFTIDKVKVLREYVNLNYRFKAEEFIIPLDQNNAAPPINLNGKQNEIKKSAPGLKEKMGLKKPALKPVEALK